MKELYAKLLDAGIEALEQEPLSRHTSFRIGGPAEVMAFPKSIDQLRTVLSMAKPTVILGAGTNVLAPDAGLPGLCICTRDCLCQMERLEDNQIRVMSGVLMSRCATFARDEALTGMEFAHGIPGTIGGGIYMNAGAYGGELCQIAEKTVTMTMDGTLKMYVGQEQGFGYRKSTFMDKEEIIIETILQLQPGNQEEISARMQELSAKRRASQPLELPSGGSAFKRPVGGYAAALIEQSGLKGQGVGGVQVSTKHAGFLVNVGGATCADVLATIAMVQKRVLECTGIALEPELRVLGQ